MLLMSILMILEVPLTFNLALEQLLIAYDEYKYKGLSASVKKVIKGEDSPLRSSVMIKPKTYKMSYMNLDPKIKCLFGSLLFFSNFIIGFFVAKVGLLLQFVGATFTPFIIFVVPSVLYYQ